MDEILFLDLSFDLLALLGLRSLLLRRAILVVTASAFFACFLGAA